MFLLFAIVWTIFGSSEIQPWNTYWQLNNKQQYGHAKFSNHGSANVMYESSALINSEEDEPLY